jgi:hypothetical protein
MTTNNKTDKCRCHIVHANTFKERERVFALMTEANQNEDCSGVYLRALELFNDDCPGNPANDGNSDFD